MSLYRDYRRLSSEPVSQTEGGSPVGATTKHIVGVTRLGEEPAPPPPPPEEPAVVGVPLTEYKSAPTLGELMAQERAKREASRAAKAEIPQPIAAQADHELYQRFVTNRSWRKRD